MKKKLLSIALGAGLSTAAWAADHVDAPAASAEPTADIADLYAWMTPDAAKLNLVMTVNPFATAASMWSDAVIYAFHIESSPAYGMPGDSAEVLCRFYDATQIECWAEGEYVVGDPSNPAGISSESGALKVYAGLRDDPFFFELTGFNNAIAAVIDAAPALDFDPAGCPQVDADTSGALIGLLTSGTDGAPASDTLAGANVLSLVVQIDKTVINSGGPILAIWSSTHAVAE